MTSKNTYSYSKFSFNRFTSDSRRNISSSSAVSELLTYIDQENHTNDWSRRFHGAELYKCPDLPLQSPKLFRDDAELLKYIKETLVLSGNNNIASVCDVSSQDQDTSIIDIVYLTPKFTLHDVLTFSPAVFQNSFCKVQFVIYQLLQCQHYLHSKGTVLGSITLQDVYIDENLWISVCPKFCQEVTISETTTGSAQSDTVVEDNSQTVSGDKNVSVMMDKWVNGAISNYDYLTYINQCCGRVFGNPNHHPVLPWIMDFSQPLGGWRDLSKSKFRLNKGDAQLDQTYEVAQRILDEGVNNQDHYEVSQTVFPHHISDVLSDITYFTYKARRTAKETLCQFVRQKWVPHEYPSSIRRLQEWTPDECIPEFYTDPSIFISIHDDLPDLEIPTWAQSPEHFIEQHRAALESDAVSHDLHHWIDLTFGVKLSGKAAVEAKNVCLELVDRHTAYSDYGIVQLFTKPHPVKVLPTKYISARAPDILRKHRLTGSHQVSSNSASDSQDPLTDSSEFDDIVKSMESLSAEKIQLPPDFDPLELLNRIDKNPHTSPVAKKCRCHDCPYHRDTLYLGCLLAKIILPLPTRALPDSKSMQLEGYVKCVQQIVVNQKHILPRALYCILEAVLEITEDGANSHQCKYTESLPPVTAGLLLAQSVLPFPPYFYSLYELLSTHLLTAILTDYTQFTQQSKDVEMKERLTQHTQFVGKYGVMLEEEGLDLYLPYIKQLFTDSNGDMCVQAVWYLFSPLSQILGKEGTQQHLSPHILDLYSRSDVSSARKVKLFHRALLQQLVTQMRVTHFIQDYSQALITALCSTVKQCDSSLISADTATTSQQPSVADNHGVDLASVLTESIVWLAGRLGPLLTAKYFTSKILQTMKDCYCVSSAFEERSVITDELTSIMVTGDILLLPAIKCLEEIAFLYGEQFILLQYIPSITRVIYSCDNSPLQTTSPASLLSCCTLLLHLIPCLTEGTLLDLIETRLISDVLLALVAIVSSPHYSFPSFLTPEDGTASRRLLAFRVLDLIILISQRIGYDQTRRFLRRTLQAFFRSFDIVHTDGGSWSRCHETKNVFSTADPNEFVDIKQSVTDANDFYVGTPVLLDTWSPTELNISANELRRSGVSPDVLSELEEVFTAELAHKAYIQCCRLVGGLYITELANDDLIRRLCTKYEEDIIERNKRMAQTETCGDKLLSDSSNDDVILGDKTKTTNWFIPVPGTSPLDLETSTGPLEVVSGNKLTYISPVNESKAVDTTLLPMDSESKYQAISAEKLKRPDMEAQTVRHLKGDWVAYWEHELGHSKDRASVFDFKQIGLQVFTGHVGAVKSLHVLDNENSLVSAGKDKTVKLWSLRNTGSGSSRCSAQFTYSEHRRPVFFSTYMESVKQIVSCDGSIHVWDAMNGAQVSQYDSSKPALGFTTVQTISNALSSHLIVAGTSESTIRFIDIRADKLAHEFRINNNASGLGNISGIAVGPTWIAVAHAVGYVYVLDIRTGFILASWICKAMEGDLTQIVSYSSEEMLTYSTDGQLSLWRHNSPTPLCQTRLSHEQQINAIRLYEKTVVAASTTNRVSTYHPNIYEGKFQCDVGDKLRPDVFKGNFTSMAILPLNRQLLLGSENGTIHLVA